MARVSSSKRRRAAVLGAAASAFVGIVAATSDAAPEQGRSDAGPPIPSCIHVSSEARYVPFGYSHIVVLASSCTKDATCSVSTDVSPEKQSVQVPKGTKVEVVTFLASPSQAFTANVSCALR